MGSTFLIFFFFFFRLVLLVLFIFIVIDFMCVLVGGRLVGSETDPPAPGDACINNQD